MSITAASGFRAGAVAAGIKPGGGIDLAVVLAERPAIGAGLFTTNRAAAAPVVVSRRHLARGENVRAVLLNSGCANAGTGDQGIVDADISAAALASVLGCPTDEVLLCSTGPIGPRLPVASVKAAISALVEGAGTSPAHGRAAATAILTTDTRPKEATSRGDGFVVGGMAKGAAMIRPNLATMLAILTTDALTDSSTLKGILSETAGVTFNALNIDGCQSTNDAVIVMASGASRRSPDADELGKTVEEVCRQLAREMAADAEGASRIITVVVSGAADNDTARGLGRAVADSALVRSSFYTGDPNWGRVLGALGAAGVEARQVTISYQGVTVAAGGVGVPFEESALSDLLRGDFALAVEVGDGRGGAEVLTTDLTPDYVRLNGERS